MSIKLFKNTNIAILIIGFITLFSHQDAFSQEKKTRWGVQAGIGFSGFGGNEIGYDFSVFGATSTSRKCYVQYGLGFQSLQYMDEDWDSDDKYNAYYISLPVNFGFHFPIGIGAFFVAAGPNFRYMVGSSDGYFDDAKKFDIGLGAKYGFEFYHVQLGMGYEYGLMSVYDNGDHNSYLNFTVSVVF